MWKNNRAARGTTTPKINELIDGMRKKIRAARAATRPQNNDVIS